MAEEGTRHMDTNLYNTARWETNVPVGVAANELYLYLTHGDRNNALHIAAQHGNPEFINKVLAAQAEPEDRYRLLYQENSRGETPLHLAAEFGCKAAVKGLLRAHDNDAAAFQPFVAQRIPCWSKRDTKGDTPLHRALRNGHDDIAMLLLGKDRTLVSICNESGESPAYLAMERSCNSALRRIVEIDNKHPDRFSGPFGQTVFHAVRNCDGNIMERLININGVLLRKKDEKGTTVIHYLVENNRLTTVETLLRFDSSLGYLQDNDGLTPLLVASRNGLLPMVRTILKLCPQSMEIRDNQGKTVLHVATIDSVFLWKCLQDKTIKELINQVDNDGNTPLHTALLKSDYRAAFCLLVSDGCNWRLKNNEGYSPLDLCKSNDTIPYKEPVYSALRDLEGGQRQVIWTRSRRITFAVEVMKEEEVEQLLNKIAIAAGLVMTITFQMALNVPGGFDNTTGFPTLHNNSSFTIATCANSLAFSSATGVLLLRTFGMHSNKKVMAMGSLVLLYLALCGTLAAYQRSLLAMGLRLASHFTVGYLSIISIFLLFMLPRYNFIFPHLD